MLIALAKGTIRFRGYGIDMNPMMCRLARSGARERGVTARIVIRRSDAALPARILPAGEIRTIDGVRGRISTGHPRRSGRVAASAIDLSETKCLVRRLLQRTRTPIRSTQSSDRHLVRAISGQGVPPATKSAWQLLYHCAGCTLIRSCNFDGAIRWSVYED